MPRVILWGMVVMGAPLSRSKSWGVLMRVVAVTAMLYRQVLFDPVRLMSCFRC